MWPSLLIGGLIGLYPGYKMFEYIWVDAGFCTTCHVHDYVQSAWDKSVHGKVTTCHDCHHQSLHEYMIEPIILITKWPKFPMGLDHVPHVPNEICEACHMKNPKDMSTLAGPLSKNFIKNNVRKVDDLYLHKLHLSETTDLAVLEHFKIPKDQRSANKAIDVPKDKITKKRPIECSDCHGGPTNRAHNFSAVDYSCIRCHEKVHDSAINTKFGCKNCHFHDFITSDNNKN